MFGKKNPIIEVIKYEGPQDVLVWKHPAEDFNTKSQLIVQESQTAIFFKNGQALEEFPSGRYTLDTQNIPFLRGIVGKVTGGVSPFQCQVYYINQVVSMGIDWGTDSPIPMMDVEYGLPITLTSYGDYSLKVLDGRKFLVKLVGTMAARHSADEDIAYTQEEIKRYFNEILAMHIRDCIANTMEREQIGGMHVNTHLINLAKGIRGMLAPIFEEYGLLLNHFTVSNVSVRGLEEIHETLKKVKLDTIAETGKAGIERIKIDVDAERLLKTGSAKNNVMLQQGLAEAQINNAKGITESQRMAFNVAEKLAGNTGPSVSVLPGMGDSLGFAGIPGMGSPVVQSPAGSAVDIVKTAIGEKGILEEQAKNERKERLRELKEWFEEGLIDEEEYKEKRKEILDRL